MYHQSVRNTKVLKNYFLTKIWAYNVDWVPKTIYFKDQRFHHIEISQLMCNETDLQFIFFNYQRIERSSIKSFLKVFPWYS